MKNVGLSILGVAVILVCAYFWLSSNIDNDAEQPLITQRADITGTYVCLPYKEEFTAEQGDCAAGVHADSGEYYAIDLGLMSQEAEPLVEGDRFSASGVITPIETLSTDYWDRFVVSGIFSVTDSVQIIVRNEQELQSMTFEGVLPCASCTGIQTTLTLLYTSEQAASGTYSLSEVYVGESDEVIVTQGSYSRVVADEQIHIVLTTEASAEPIADYVVTSADTLRLFGNDGTAFTSDLPYDLHAVEPNHASALQEKNWAWKYTDLQSGEQIAPNAEGQFLLRFENDGTFTSSTDCNSLGGKYVVDGEVLSLADMIATKMFCADSLEGEYTAELLQVNSFIVQSNELHLNLDRDQGVMVFKGVAK